MAGWLAVDDVDGEVLGPGVAVEAGAEHGAVLGPGVAGVGGGVDAEDAQVALLPGARWTASFCSGDHGVSPMVKRARTRADGELVGRDVADVGDHGRGEAGQAGQLGEAGGGLGQDAVHAGRPVDVGGHLRDDQHVVGHAGSVGLVRRPRPVVECTGPGAQQRCGAPRGARRHDVGTANGENETAAALAATGFGDAWASRAGAPPTAGCGPPGPARPLAAPAYPVGCTPGDNLAVHVAVTKAPAGERARRSTWARWPTVGTGARC